MTDGKTCINRKSAAVIERGYNEKRVLPGLSMRSFEIARVERHDRGRKTGRVRTQFFVGRVAHLKFKRPAIDDVGVAGPELIQRFAVQADAWNVFVIARIVFTNDPQGFAIMQANGDAIKDRTAQIVNGHAWCHRIKSRSEENDKRAHAATVLVARHA